MPATAGAAPAPISSPAPAGGLEFDTASYSPDVHRVHLAGTPATGTAAGSYTNMTGYPQRVQKVAVHADTAPTAAAGLVVDVNVEGASVFAAAADRPKVAQGAKTAAVAPKTAEGGPVLLAPGDTLTVDVDAVNGAADVDVAVELAKHAANNLEGIAY